MAFTEGGTATSTAATGKIGFNFSVNQSISVTELGFYGDALGGGDTPKVSLFNFTSGTQLATASYSPANGWTYVTLPAPVTLVMGQRQRKKE